MRILSVLVDGGRCRWSAVGGRRSAMGAVVLVAASVAAPSWQFEDHGSSRGGPVEPRIKSLSGTRSQGFAGVHATGQAGCANPGELS
jgi:hypothetical protein